MTYGALHLILWESVFNLIYGNAALEHNMEPIDQVLTGKPWCTQRGRDSITIDKNKEKKRQSKK